MCNKPPPAPQTAPHPRRADDLLRLPLQGERVQMAEGDRNTLLYTIIHLPFYVPITY
jgi:hypothetical protein